MLFGETSITALRRARITATSRKTKERLFLLAVFAMVLSARLLVLFYFFPDNLAGDEERHQGVLALHLQDGLLMPLNAYRYESYAGGTVLTGILAAPFFRLLGPTVFALRLPSLLLAALGAAFLALAFRRALGSVAGILAGLALAFPLPYSLRMSVTAFGNHAESASLLGLWIFACVAAAFDTQKRGTAWSMFLLGLVASFCVLQNGLALLFVPFGVVMCWLARGRRPRWSNMLGFAGGAAVGAVPWLVLLGGIDFLRQLRGLAIRPPGTDYALRGKSFSAIGGFIDNGLLPSFGLKTSWAILLFLFLAATLAILVAGAIVRAWRGTWARGDRASWVFRLLIVGSALAYLAQLFFLRADSPARYFLPVWPLLLTVPVLLVGAARFFVPLALVLPIAGLFGTIGHFAHHEAPDIRNDGYSYHYFLPTFSAFYSVTERADKVVRVALEGDDCDREMLYRLFVIGEAAEMGRDISRHVRRPAGGRDASAQSTQQVRSLLTEFMSALKKSADPADELDRRVDAILSLNPAESAKYRVCKAKDARLKEDFAEALQIVGDAREFIKLLRPRLFAPLPFEFRRARSFGAQPGEGEIPDIQARFIAGPVGPEFDLFRSCDEAVFSMQIMSRGAVFLARNLVINDPARLPKPGKIKSDTVGVSGGPARVNGRDYQVAPFRIDRTETSVSDFVVFLNTAQPPDDELTRYVDLNGTGQKIARIGSEYRYYQGCARYPVVYVTADGAQAFCRWRGGRLPTSAEWERATHGDDQRAFPWGNQPLDARRANILGGDDGYPSLAPVDAFLVGASPFGVLQMVGNVREWTALPGAGNPGFLLFGDSWRGNGDQDYQFSNDASSANEHDGFRCVYPE